MDLKSIAIGFVLALVLSAMGLLRLITKPLGLAA